MSQMTSVPMALHPMDVMTNGPSMRLETAGQTVHPVETIQQQHMKNQHEMKKDLLGKVYGNHFVLRMNMEERIIGQIRPGPGQTSKYTALETLLGRDTDIEFEDYLNDPQYRTTMVDAFTEMEKRMGDKPTHTY